MKLRLITAAVAATLTLSIVDGKTPQRSIEIKNESGTRSVLFKQSILQSFLLFLIVILDFVHRLELYWINKEEVLMQNPNVVNGQSVALNSYVNHTFMVKEIPDSSGLCKVGKYTVPSASPVCRSAYVTVNDHHNQGKAV